MKQTKKQLTALALAGLFVAVILLTGVSVFHARPDCCEPVIERCELCQSLLHTATFLKQLFLAAGFVAALTVGLRTGFLLPPGRPAAGPGTRIALKVQLNN